MVKTRYRRKIRKTLAAIMSVSMLMSSVSFSSFASETEGTKEAPKLTVTITEVKNEATGDTTKTTITDSEWNEKETFVPETEAAEQESESAIQESESAEQESESAVQESESAEQESESAVQESESAEQESESAVQESESAEQESESAVQESESTEQESESVPQDSIVGENTVTGSETKTETTITNKKGQVIEESEKIEGQETITDEITKTDVEVKTNQVIDETKTPIDSETSTDGEPVETIGKTEEGKETFGEYDVANGSWTDHDFGPTEKEHDPTTTSDVTLKDPLAAEKDKVALEMTPGGKEATEKVYVSWADIQSGAAQIPKAGTKQGTDAEGNPTVTETTVTPVKQNGEVVGYTVEVKTTTTKTSDLIPGEDYVISSTDREPVTSAPKLPDGIEAGTKELTDASGNVIGSITTTIEEIKDNAGNVIGYTITEVKTEEHDTEDTVIAAGETTKVDDKPTESIILPEKPQSGESTNEETGVKTVVTVEDIVEDGKHVGYKTTTVQLDKKGNEVSRSSESLYGKKVTVNKTTITDPTTEKTTTDTTTTTTTTTTIKGTTTYTDVVLGTDRTQTEEVIEVTDSDTWKLVEADGNMYFLYKGQMYEVTGTSVMNSKEDIVTSNTVSTTAYANDVHDVRTYGEAIINDKGQVVYVDNAYTGQRYQAWANDSNRADGQWRLVGNGLFSDYTLTESTATGLNGPAHSARQFAIKDGKEIRYVYCVELGTNVSTGAYYSSNKYDKDNAAANAGTPWHGASGTVSQLRSVAINGFWGTTSGIGSLEAVKDLMRRNNLSKEAELLTAGKAVAATQAAIWEFAAATQGKFGDDFVTFDDELGTAPTKEEEAVIIALRDLLVKLAKAPDGSGVAEKIDADDITGATIILDKKANETVQDKAGKSYDLYESDLSFTLAVSTSSINGDLIVRVTDSLGRVIATKRLAGDDQTSKYKTSGKITPDKDGNYTIENIKLAEGVTITLNLEGTQHLDDGVYIYKSEGYQDFIGLSKLENAVDLEVTMKFEVEEAGVDLQHKGSESTRSKNNTYTDSRTGTRVDSREDYTTEVDTKTVVNGETVKTIYADVTVVEVTETVTKTEREWNSGWKKEYNYQSDDPGNDDPEEEKKKDDKKTEIIEDPIVPLGNTPSADPGTDEAIQLTEDGNVTLQALPKTGDVSALWMILSALSGLGLAAVSLTEKRRKEDE